MSAIGVLSRPRTHVATAARVDRTTLAAAVFAGALAILLTWNGFRVLQADSYRLLYAGRLIATHGVSSHYIFTLAAQGRPYADQQWLAELGAYVAWLLGGYAAVALLFAAAFGAGIAGLVALLCARGASAPVAIGSAMLAIFGLLSLAFVRAEMLVMPLFVAMLWLVLSDADAGHESMPRRTLLLIPVLVLWANLHGSVLIGAAIVAVHLLYRCVRVARHRRGLAVRYGLLAIAAALTPLATPALWHVLAYYQSMMGNHAVAIADIEWDPPVIGQLSSLQFAVPLLAGLGSTVLAWRAGRRPSATLLIAIAICAVAASIAMRNDMWLGLAGAALVAETASAWIPTSKPTTTFRLGLAGAALVLALVALTMPLSRPSSGYQAGSPLSVLRATTAYVADHPCARVLADNQSASALLWLDPKLVGRVGFDGELEVYSQPALRSWIAFQAAASPRWLSAARNYQVLVGATSDHPQLVSRLAGLRTTTLARSAAGIAVLNPGAPSCGAANTEGAHNA
jgi:hypothetical protein